MPSAQRLLALKEKIRHACISAGRPPSEVQLVAVSKTFPETELHPVYQAGQRHFGENYAQELRDKGQSFTQQGIDDITWHFIGRIQSNKIKHIAAHASYVHSVEKVAHAQALGAHAPRPLKVFITVNIAREQSKGGLPPEETLQRCEEIHQLENIEVCGLMCLPPRCEDPEESAPYFEQMAALTAEGRARGLPLTELSMGMSNDFHVAIRYGATWVRVGSAIFGARMPKP